MAKKPQLLETDIEEASKLCLAVANSAADVRDRAALAFISTVLTRMAKRMRELEAASQPSA